MEKTVNIKGNNPIDLNNRIKAVETINSMSATEVKNLKTLIDSGKARSYLSSDTKFMMLKPMI